MLLVALTVMRYNPGMALVEVVTAPDTKPPATAHVVNVVTSTGNPEDILQ
jgi:hypothetical protein